MFHIKLLIHIHKYTYGNKAISFLKVVYDSLSELIRSIFEDIYAFFYSIIFMFKFNKCICILSYKKLNKDLIDYELFIQTLPRQTRNGLLFVP